MRGAERNPLNKPIISVSGIRGILGTSLTPEIIIKYISAFARFTGNNRIVVGRDGRLFGDLVENQILSVLSFSGCEVVALGIAPTPTIALAVKSLKAHGGISITASHNPQEWNGMKFINRSGFFLDKTENNRLLKLAEPIPAGIKRGPLSKPYVNIGRIKPIEYYLGFENFHISKILNSQFVNVSQIRKRKFKIVLDCVNASGSYIIPMLLKKLGCDVIKVDCDGSGIFTRKPEPIPQNLKRTCAFVKKSRADLGIVVDPDSDRLVIIA